jgi:hypothetical protein
MRAARNNHAFVSMCDVAPLVGDPQGGSNGVTSPFLAGVAMPRPDTDIARNDQGHLRYGKLRSMWPLLFRTGKLPTAQAFVNANDLVFAEISVGKGSKAMVKTPSLK